MPFGDGTGPWGQGPMTGRGAGYCGGYGAPGYANPVPGGGRFGMGIGRGAPYGYYQTGPYGGGYPYAGYGSYYGWGGGFGWGRGFGLSRGFGFGRGGGFGRGRGFGRRWIAPYW